MIEKCELDKRWFVEKHPDATENEIDCFQEKTAIFEKCAGFSEDDARIEARFVMTGASF